jgi:Fe-S cluster assembly ATPase SufC
MIKSITIPQTAFLHKFFSEKLTFTDGINVIYGPNGSGKSLLLSTLARHTFIQGKGWSKPLSFSETGFISSFYKFDIKKYLAYEYDNFSSNDRKIKGQCDVEWDGMPVFKSEGILPKEHLSRVAVEIMMGCTNKEDISKQQMKSILDNNLSSGQTAKLYVDSFLSMEVPVISEPKSERWNIDYENLLADYVAKLSGDGKPTILIDELDAHFDFDNLYIFWSDSINKLVEKYQVIIVTHNPFFIDSTRMNIIGNDYYLKSVKKLNTLTFS